MRDAQDAEELQPLTSRLAGSSGESEDSDDVEGGAILPETVPFRGVFSRGRLITAVDDLDEESWYARRTTKAAFVVAAVAGCFMAMYCSPIAVAAFSRGRASGVELLAENYTAQHWGLDCFNACNGPGMCPGYCGFGNACCRFADVDDPPECLGILSWGATAYHTCVVTTNPAYTVVEHGPQGVKNWGTDCWAPCGNKSGYCESFCGTVGICCRWGALNAPECTGVEKYGSKSMYTCVGIADQVYQVLPTRPNASRKVLHWGEDCLPACNHSGYCRSFCGLGNACCKFQGPFQPSECDGILDWGDKDRHTCVAPVSPAFVTSKVPEGGVEHWAEDCWDACGGGGACPQFCGIGNACCRFGSTQDPPECHGISAFGTKEEHTCVKPVAPYLYVNHFAENCWDKCDGAGYCEDWCGTGNACCKYGRAEDPHECRGVTYFPTHETHTCVKASGRYGIVPEEPSAGACIPGEAHNSDGKCVPATAPALMTFYLYHAASDDSPNLQNVDLANAQGILMLVHRHVVTACPRNGDITRIIRYVVHIRNTDALFKATKKQFAPYELFANGKCVPENASTPCLQEYGAYGYVVGCQVAKPSDPLYGKYAEPTFYSFPGGGDGDAGDECFMPDGGHTCTWKTEYAGEVRLDELSGLSSSLVFCSTPGNVEYNITLDKGHGSMFWDNRRDAEACAHRVLFMQELFKLKYPNYPRDLGYPKCDL